MRKEWTDWEAWLIRRGPVALLYARQLTRSPQDAEDVVHDAFLRFWPQRKAARNADAFFLACVRTAALDRRRGELRRQRRQEVTAARKPLFEAGGVAGLGRREEVEKALEELPEVQREVVVLKIWGGLTLSQIAQTCGVSMGTIASRYRAAIEKLGALLGREFEYER